MKEEQTATQSLCSLTEDDIKDVVTRLFAENAPFQSVEEAYQHLAQLMYDYFQTNHEPDLILSRIYHSFTFALLPESLKKVAKEVWGDQAKENSKFMTLMGTYGQEDSWRDRTQSKGHKVILLTHDSLKQIPMVSRLMHQIGFNLDALLSDGESGIEYEGLHGAYGVFYVPAALDSPYIPAQDFVKQCDVKTVFGTGVMLPQGDISIYIGFSRFHIDKQVVSNVASLMPLFWQQAFMLLAERGMFS